MNKPKPTLINYIAKIATTLIFLFARAIALIPSRSVKKEPQHKILVFGAFHNTGWFHAHIKPLLYSDAVSEVLVVHNEPIYDHEKLKLFIPKFSDSNIILRNTGRILQSIIIAAKHRPTIYMGYHIMPNSLYALTLSRIFGGKSVYQMTGGPIQIAEGGYRSENPLLALTGTPSKFIESRIFAAVRCFDLVIVRGGWAKSFVAENNLSNNCQILTGSIDTDRFSPKQDKEIDLLHVSRLIPNKGIEDFIHVIAHLKNNHPEIRGVIAGEGPIQQELEKLINDLAVQDNVTLVGKVTDAENYMGKAKAFLLLSKSEGMSIAMLEAMSCGCMTMVRDVGELSDILTNDNGLLISPSYSAEEAAALIEEKLFKSDDYLSLGTKARQSILDQKSLQATANTWSKYFTALDH